MCLIFPLCFSGPCRSWRISWDARRVGLQGTISLTQLFMFMWPSTKEKLSIICTKLCAEDTAAHTAFDVWSGDVLCGVSIQGDRGFDGLPGLSGEKGHRVSPVWSSSAVQFVKTMCQSIKVLMFSKSAFLLQMPLKLNTWDICPLTNNEPDLEGILLNNRVVFCLRNISSTCFTSSWFSDYIYWSLGIF